VFIVSCFLGLFSCLSCDLSLRRIPAAVPALPVSESLSQSFIGAVASFIIYSTPNKNYINSTINPLWPGYDLNAPNGLIFNVTNDGTADSAIEALEAGLLDRCQ